MRGTLFHLYIIYTTLYLFIVFIFCQSNHWIKIYVNIWNARQILYQVDTDP